MMYVYEESHDHLATWVAGPQIFGSEIDHHMDITMDLMVDHDRPDFTADDFSDANVREF